MSFHKLMLPVCEPAIQFPPGSQSRVFKKLIIGLDVAENLPILNPQNLLSLTEISAQHNNT